MTDLTAVTASIMPEGLDNAVREFGVDRKIQSVIDSHMWPLNPLRIPKSREAWILWIANKIETFREMRVKQ